MTLKFGRATMGQLNANALVYDNDSGFAFKPLKIAAIEGGSLERKTVNGQALFDSFGQLVLQKSEKTTGPYYFHIIGANASENLTVSNKFVDLIVPFDNCGINASTSRLDIVG